VSSHLLFYIIYHKLPIEVDTGGAIGSLKPANLTKWDGTIVSVIVFNSVFGSLTL
jgi:hypothetical protein